MNDEALVEAILDAIERHKTHRLRWRRDPDGMYRCPACYPLPVWRRALDWAGRRR